MFAGRGALVVSCALDPDALADSIPGLTWIAFKVGGSDVAPVTETEHCRARWTARGLEVGAWTYCTGPPMADAARFAEWAPLPFVVYDVEQPYKADEGGNYGWARELVGEHFAHGGEPAAVTSYGGYKSSIDFAAFAGAGWPVLAQVYDSFSPGDERTYWRANGGPYPPAGVHRLTRSLELAAGEAVYRPESLG